MDVSHKFDANENNHVRRVPEGWAAYPEFAPLDAALAGALEALGEAAPVGGVVVEALLSSPGQPVRWRRVAGGDAAPPQRLVWQPAEQDFRALVVQDATLVSGAFPSLSVSVSLLVLAPHCHTWSAQPAGRSPVEALRAAAFPYGATLDEGAADEGALLLAALTPLDGAAPLPAWALASWPAAQRRTLRGALRALPLAALRAALAARCAATCCRCTRPPRRGCRPPRRRHRCSGSSRAWSRRPQQQTCSRRRRVPRPPSPRCVRA